MNPRETIAVFYSPGRSFADALEHVRRHYPQAIVTAIIPAGYAASPREINACDHLIQTEAARFSILRPGPLARLIRNLRKQRFGRLVILFDSTRLRLLAGAVRAPQTVYFTIDRQFRPIATGIPRTLIAAAARWTAGHALYYTLWLLIRLFPIRKPKHDATRPGIPAPPHRRQRDPERTRP